MTFRDERPACLYCDGGLEKRARLWFCGQCHSKLYPTRELETALDEVSPDDIRPLEQRLIPSVRVRGPSVCPLCKTEMTTWSIYDVAVDRCDAHGIWIDRDGDATIILRNEAMYTARNPRTPRGAWFPFGLGVIVGALLSPWLDRRQLRKDIERTSPPKPPKR